MATSCVLNPSNILGQAVATPKEPQNQVDQRAKVTKRTKANHGTGRRTESGGTSIEIQLARTSFAEKHGRQFCTSAKDTYLPLLKGQPQPHRIDPSASISSQITLLSHTPSLTRYGEASRS